MSSSPIPGITDVAARAGVSPALVSRLLNDDPNLRIRDDKRQQILDAVAELSYVPHSSARALRRARSGALGLFVHDLSSPIYSEVIRGAQASAAAADCVLLFGDTDDLDASESALGSALAARRIDGLLVQGGYSADAAAAISQVAGQVPTVVINAAVSGQFSSVRLADEAAARLAGQHLLELGHTHVAFLAGPAGSDTSRRREHGVREVMDVPKKYLARTAWDAHSGVTAMTALLRARPRPTGVVAANVTVAVGALTAARQAGVDVPNDISVVAIHDAWFAEHVAPPLTTIHLPLAELGHRAVKVLVDQIAGAAPQDLLVETEPRLIRRESTAPL